MKETNKSIKHKIFFIILSIIILIMAIIYISVFLSFTKFFTSPMIDKPVIYIYPEEETQVKVTLGNSQNLTCTYPKYEDSWIVNAKPDGTLTELKNPSRELYSLYYESTNKKPYSKDLKEGFIVKSSEVSKFLEEKLSLLGLSDKESQEFIIYWLPRLEAHKYIYIRFQSMEEIEKNMPLYFDKTPDTLIRIVMEWKGLDKSRDIKQQQLTPVKRNGFTVVEWGGTELK